MKQNELLNPKEDSDTEMKYFFLDKMETGGNPMFKYITWYAWIHAHPRCPLQVSHLASQKFFLIWLAETILEGWEAELETDPFMCI